MVRCQFSNAFYKLLEPLRRSLCQVNVCDYILKKSTYKLLDQANDHIENPIKSEVVNAMNRLQ